MKTIKLLSAIGISLAFVALGFYLLNREGSVNTIAGITIVTFFGILALIGVVGLIKSYNRSPSDKGKF